MSNTAAVEKKSVMGLKSGPIVIEFVGLPGSGKTTTASTLKLKNVLIRTRFLRGDRRNRLGIFRKAGKTVYCWIVHYKLSLSIARLILVNFRHNVSIKHCLSLPVSAHKIHVARTKDFKILIDQGLIQDVWSLGATGEPLPDNETKRLLHALKPYLPEIAIFFDIDFECAINRINNRSSKNSRFDLMKREQQMKYLKIQQVAMEKLVEMVEKDQLASIVSINAGLEPEVVCREVSVAIHRQLEGI